MIYDRSCLDRRLEIGMQDLFRKLYDTVSAGEPAVLVTIVASSGSTPRGSGARMLVTEKGRIAGTVGGGAVEFEAEKLAKQCIASKGSTRASFRLDHNEVADIGMICGGNVDVYFRYISGNDQYMCELAKRIDELFERGEQSWLITQIGEDNNGTVSVLAKTSGLIGENVPQSVLEKIGNRPSQISENGVNYYVEKLVQAGRVFVFGGGHVSQKLVPALTRCDFRCVVLEDRPEFAKPELFENMASDIRVIDMDRIEELIPSIGPDDYICIMTRGHKDDYLVQRSMLKTPACYIGVIGSSHKIAGVNAKLRADGFTDRDIARITTPIGLDILSETPAEIAVSIVAQLIMVRAKKNGSRKCKKLFIEGDSGLGKTTLILNTLGAELVKRAGGFSTVRILDDKGKRMGYSVKASSEMKTVDETATSENTRKMFISFADAGGMTPICNGAVFTEHVTSLLKASEAAPFIIMDEFGGIELEDDEFVDELIRVITSEIPVIGVIKSRKSAKRLSERMGVNANYMANYERLRAVIEKEGKGVIDLRSKGTEYAKEKIEAWKSSIPIDDEGQSAGK